MILFIFLFPLNSRESQSTRQNNTIPAHIKEGGDWHSVMTIYQLAGGRRQRIEKDEKHWLIKAITEKKNVKQWQLHEDF